MVSIMCGGNQVRSTKTSVSCLQSSIMVGVSWSGAALVLLALGSYSSLREPWMPTCTVTYWSKAWSPPFRDWAAGQYSNMITTTALLKNLRVKVMDWPSISPDLNPIEHLWGILKQKVVCSGLFGTHWREVAKVLWVFFFLNMLLSNCWGVFFPIVLTHSFWSVLSDMMFFSGFSM